MSRRYWIMPVEREEPLVFAEDRVCISESAAWEVFADRLHRLKPRLLPMVKASILPADPDDSEPEACGYFMSPAYLTPGLVCFDGAPYALSECGQAFVDRLPEASVQLTGLQMALEHPLGEQWSDLEQGWLKTLCLLSGANRKLMLVRED